MASFTHLWNDGGMFPKGISGFFMASRSQYSPSSALSWSGHYRRGNRIRSHCRAINSIPIASSFYVFALIVIMSVTW